MNTGLTDDPIVTCRILKAVHVHEKSRGQWDFVKSALCVL